MVSTRSQISTKVHLIPTRKSKDPTTPKKPLPRHPIRTKISALRPPTLPQPPNIPFPLQPATYGLIQERIRTSLYALVVQAILWNQTTGLTARPVLFRLLSIYPTPLSLSLAEPVELTALLQPIGLQNVRCKRLIGLALAWVAAPPCKGRRYRKLHYPRKGSGGDVRPGEVLGEDDEREGWEVAHLTGLGAYAIDSFRIFYRDRLRGVEGSVDEGFEAEWRRVVPLDKDLRAYLKWRWAEDGWDWDELTGRRKRIKDLDVGGSLKVA